MNVDSLAKMMRDKFTTLRIMFKASSMDEDEKIRMAYIAGLDVGSGVGRMADTAACLAICRFEVENK